MNRSVKSTDVIVVGSGAAGGMAAYSLTQSGVRVLMLEAGRDYDPVNETPMFNLPSEAPLRAAPTPDKVFGYYDATVNGGWDIPDEPYTVAEGSRFRLWRARMLGGRTNHWGRMSLRFGPYDFKGRSRDGIGVDWPINYDDVAPYYDKVEGLIGVFGAAEGIENSPDSPPGLLHDPPKPHAYEVWSKMVMERKHGIPVVPSHLAILTRPHGDRPSCIYATECWRGCSIRANFQSPTVLLPPALATGKLQIQTNSMAYEIILNSRGQAAGVRYLDTTTGKQHEVRSRAVVLGASTVESARILMLSRSKAYPDGIGNSGGHLGRNLTDTPVYSLSAQVPQLESLPPFNDEGVSMFHVYTPWWLNKEQAKGKFDFARGYQIQFWGGRRLPQFTDITSIAELTDSYGTHLHSDLRRLFGSIIWLSIRGEMLPNARSYCDLDPMVTDRWGLPVLRFHWEWSDEEVAQMRHGRTTMLDIFETMGARLLSEAPSPTKESMLAGGNIIHEVGACRMGTDASNSVVDSFGRCWDVPNVYVADGGVFASNPYKNPTLTILALAWRGADHLAESLRRRDI